MGVVAQLRSKTENRLGRSDRSAAGRWFWEIDRVLLFFVAVLIAIGLIAVAAASPAASQRLSGGGVSYAPLYHFYRQLVWIVGGLAKTKDLGPCEAQLGHVRGAYTIGDSGPMFAQLLAGKVPVTECGLLTAAVEEAADAAEAGEVVLLSPACASFDQFRDYEARGQAFREAVGALS